MTAAVPTAGGTGAWLSLVLGGGLLATWDQAPGRHLLDAVPARGAGSWGAAARLRSQRVDRDAAGPSALDPRPILAALDRRLRAGGVPPRRRRRALAATETFLRRAIRLEADGSVFVITGDIPAMWLRDSAAQVGALLALADDAPEVVDLARGVLRTQARQVLLDPMANAFNPGPTGLAIRRDAADQSPWVFERKYALDSLCAPLRLAARIHEASGSLDHVDAEFLASARTIVGLWRSEQAHDPTSYRLRRRLARAGDSLSHDGHGAPVGPTGMTWSGFRPSDDACVLGYHVPANAMAAVSLERIAPLLAGAGDAALAAEATALAAEIRAGIARFGVVDVPGAGRILAYEVDGLGNHLLLDDANVPSLLSLPELGFCERDDPLYLATRAWVLGPGDPCWSDGRAVRGVGSTHTRRGWVWPLAILVEGLTAADGDEREEALRRAEATIVGGGLMHESVHASDPRRFTRRWFSWADMLYVDLVLRSAGAAS